MTAAQAMRNLYPPMSSLAPKERRLAEEKVNRLIELINAQLTAERPVTHVLVEVDTHPISDDRTIRAVVGEVKSAYKSFRDIAFRSVEQRLVISMHYGTRGDAISTLTSYRFDGLRPEGRQAIWDSWTDAVTAHGLPVL